MTCCSVLRLGPFPIDNAECTTRLIKAILQHFPNSEHENQELTISNRYFTARVLLRAIGSEMCKELDPDAVIAEDGIILVFDALQSNPKLSTSMSASFDAIEAEHDRAVNENAGDLLRLCVGVGDSKLGLTEKEYEAEYARRVLWCLDRGYEYVEADLSEEGVRTGHEERDKEGFARIVEAISGTVWSSAVMEKRKQEESKPTLRYPNQNQNDSVENGESKNDVHDPAEVSDPNNEDVRQKMDQERAENARKALLEDLEQSSEMESSYVDDHTDDNPTTNGDTICRRREELQQERAMEALEGSIREANRLRELSRSGALSDEERRERAGDAAMLIMKMMGNIGFDESTSDEED